MPQLYAKLRFYTALVEYLFNRNECRQKRRSGDSNYFLEAEVKRDRY